MAGEDSTKQPVNLQSSVTTALGPLKLLKEECAVFLPRIGQGAPL
jgi:hypothetical protein